MGATEPWAWTIGRICEEFSTTPSQAIEEPAGLCLEIIELRAYAHAYRAYIGAKDRATVPRTPLVEEVIRNERRLARRARGEGA